ncbi:hypothetical protein PoB_003369200 [Plakobranchus ocellatus]|uniref:Uncharacterized protein n=1 Tax=Plakobranchus ocellatus TaxID=259542 RepID=A0AAV4AJK6_9GAST|nr:hypothetical protein PoB_003369200 [Plakobranchus ocellatus]
MPCPALPCLAFQANADLARRQTVGAGGWKGEGVGRPELIVCHWARDSVKRGQPGSDAKAKSWTTQH